jgi:hypothetical protein
MPFVTFTIRKASSFALKPTMLDAVLYTMHL